MSAPLDSPRRLEALRASGLLDTPAESSFDRLTRLACRLLGTPVALVSLVDDTRQFFKSCVGVSDAVAATRESSLNESYCKFIVAIDEPLIVRDARSDPAFADHPGTEAFDIGAYLGVPLHFEGEVLGSLCVLDQVPRDWTDEHVTLLRELGDLVEAQLLLHTAGAAAERAHEEAQRATARLRFLLRASEALSTSLDYHETLDALVRLCVPELADWCVVDLLDRDGRVERLSVGHTGAERVEPARALMDYTPDLNGSASVSKVLLTGEPLLRMTVTEADIQRAARDARHAELLRTLGMGSYAIVPLLSRGTAIGALSFVRQQPGSYTEEDFGLLRELGRRAGISVDKAIVYRERDDIAHTLQQSLLPPTLPDVPGLRLAARYSPQGRGQLVGGDFYDVFHARGRWVVVVGDVRGKGPAAAAVTGLARHTIRAAAMSQPSPAGILSVLNDVMLLDGSDNERFCTVACASIKPDEGGAEVVLACGGHPGPLLRHADATVGEITADGMLLGLFTDPGIVDVSLRLEPGDMLVLYTDGVTEARADDGRFLGLNGLEDMLRNVPGQGPAELADAITAGVDQWQGDVGRDDLAVLVAGVPGLS